MPRTSAEKIMATFRAKYYSPAAISAVTQCTQRSSEANLSAPASNEPPKTVPTFAGRILAWVHRLSPGQATVLGVALAMLIALFAGEQSARQVMEHMASLQAQVMGDLRKQNAQLSLALQAEREQRLKLESRLQSTRETNSTDTFIGADGNRWLIRSWPRPPVHQSGANCYIRVDSLPR